MDKKTPALFSKLGRMSQLRPGQYELVRVVKIKTRKEETYWAVSNICQLPIQDVEAIKMFQGREYDEAVPYNPSFWVAESHSVIEIWRKKSKLDRCTAAP